MNPQTSYNTLSSLAEFTKHIPVRLNPTERQLLTVLESTLHVSEYTDNVDVASNRYGGNRYGYGGGVGSGGGKAKKILDGILEACHVITGLAVVGENDSIHANANTNVGSSSSNKVKSSSSSSSSNFENLSLDTENNNHKSRKASKQAEKAKKKLMKKLKKKQMLEKQQQELLEDLNELEGDVDDVKGDKGEEGEEGEQAPPPNQMEREDDTTTSNSNSNTHNNTPTTSPNVTSIAQLKPKQNAAFFQNIFEIGRRNKVLNPSKMRGTYGKLMHLLQDTQSPTIARSLGFTLYKDLIMVRPFLEQYGALDILEDERLVYATMFVNTRDGYGALIQRDIVEGQVKKKKEYINQLLNEYSSSIDGTNSSTTTNSTTKNKISREDLQLCIDSITDAIAVVESNVEPINRMIQLLEENFNQHSYEKGYSLELRGSGNSFSSSYNRYGSSSGGGYGFGAFGSSFSGRDSSGPTLSHSHSTQYTFVWQSLHLWKEVQKNMHKLWVCADDDLLSTTSSYQLLNTGQGLNRVQSCPKVGKIMRHLLSKTQKAAGSPWVGLSVIHLGDRDVPNALVFIDKYTQIPRFLSPVVEFIDGISSICSNEHIAKYVKDEFGSERCLKMNVLVDYFKHGFDGSGDDGGSCIDGRLTSSWNWTSRIAKKNYYHAFMLNGFQGFDGDFK